jgi:hypothetical protein
MPAATTYRDPRGDIPGHSTPAFRSPDQWLPIPVGCQKPKKRSSDTVAVQEFRHWSSQEPRRWRAFIWTRCREAGQRQIEQAAIRAATQPADGRSPWMTAAA